MINLDLIKFSLPRNRLQYREFSEYYRSLWWKIKNEKTEWSYERSLLENDIEQLSETLEIKRTTVSSLEDELATEQANLDSLQTQKAILESTIPRDDAAIAQIQTEIDAKVVLISTLNQELDRARFEVLDYEGQLDRKTNTLLGVANRLDSLDGFVAKLETHIEEVDVFFSYITKRDLESRNQTTVHQKAMISSENIMSNMRDLTNAKIDTIKDQLKKFGERSLDVKTQIEILFQMERQNKALQDAYDRQYEMWRQNPSSHPQPELIDTFDPDYLMNPLPTDPQITR